MSLGARRRRPPTPGFVANELWRRAGEVPSFHIAPARTQNATDLITGSVLGTYNSASPAWAVGPDGVLFQPAANAPVIEYDPTTLQCLGARIWGAVTNFILQSENLGASWTLFNSSSSLNSHIAPNGTLTADLVTPGNGLPDGLSRQNISGLPDNASLSGFVFLKSAGINAVSLQFYNKTNTFHFSGSVNLTTGAIENSPINMSTEVLRFPNGWYQIRVTGFNSGSGATTPNLRITSTNIGNGSNAFVQWGAQINTGPLGPYVPTTTTAASSTADVWSITGADFSRIWNQSAATMYVDAVMASATSTGNQFIARASDNTYNNQISLGLTSGGFPQFVTASGGTFDGGAGSSTIITANAAFKLAAAGQLNDLALSHSSSIFTDSLANTPTSLTRLDIGSDHMGFNRVVGMYLREFAIFRSRRPNANLQAMPQ